MIRSGPMHELFLLSYLCLNNQSFFIFMVLRLYRTIHKGVGNLGDHLRILSATETVVAILVGSDESLNLKNKNGNRGRLNRWALMTENERRE